MTTLGYEASSPTTLSTVNTVPVNCITAPYVAGSNEMAIINVSMHAFAPSANQVMLAPMFSQNAGNPQFAAGFYALQGAGPGSYGNVQSLASMALTPNVAYRFMIGARLLSPGEANNVVCRAVVTIAKRP